MHVHAVYTYLCSTPEKKLIQAVRKAMQLNRMVALFISKL